MVDVAVHYLKLRDWICGSVDIYYVSLGVIIVWYVYNYVSCSIFLVGLFRDDRLAQVVNGSFSESARLDLWY